jgi:hypothetical protein
VRRALVIDAVDVLARRNILESVGVGFDQRIGKIVGHCSVAVQVRVTDDGAVQQVVIKSLKLPILRILAPIHGGHRALCERLAGLRVGMNFRQATAVLVL